MKIIPKKFFRKVIHQNEKRFFQPSSEGFLALNLSWTLYLWVMVSLNCVQFSSAVEQSTYEICGQSSYLKVFMWTKHFGSETAYLRLGNKKFLLIMDIWSMYRTRISKCPVGTVLELLVCQPKNRTSCNLWSLVHLNPLRRSSEHNYVVGLWRLQKKIETMWLRSARYFVSRIKIVL